MFTAPDGNTFGATYYGTAAVSPVLFNPSDKSKAWLGSGCGNCWKVTATANIPGKDTSTTTTVVLKGTNLCPGGANPQWCGGNKAHFDISAPGFDQLAYSASNTCPEREQEEAGAFFTCDEWPENDCNCGHFNDPVLKAGCENFKSLNWDNPTVTYTEVQCPVELERQNCWEENGNGYPPFGTIPEFCASNIGSSNPPPPSTTPPNPPTVSPPVASPSSSPGASSDGCCSWDGRQTCGDTTEWCNESKENCEGSCTGGWIGTTPPNPPPVSPPVSPPVAPPSSSPEDCCSWDEGMSCGTDLWCNQSKDNCEGPCSGQWV